MTLDTRSIDGLDISVVLTLVDHRGAVADCVASWCQRQTLARDRYEVIVVGTPREAAVARQVRPRLTAADRMIDLDSGAELALHDHGAREARGRWLLFTEAHCLAEPVCLERVLEYLRVQGPDCVGACLRSQHDGSRHPVALAEARWYREGAAAWTRDGDWRKVTIRGFAIRRDVYLAVGGFEHAFGCFAESALAATLHHRGYRLGYAADAAVTHFSSTSVAELLAYVKEYRAGEEAYRAGCDPAYFTRYFGDGSAAEAPGRPGSAIGCAARSLRWAGARLHRGGARRLAASMLGQMASTPLERLGLRGRCTWARLRFALSGQDAEARFRWFDALWNATGELARREVAARPLRDVGGRAAGIRAWRDAVRGPGGFHGRETFGGRSFRWSAPLARLRVHVAPGDYDVAVDTGGLRRFATGDPVHLYLDGHRASVPPPSTAARPPPAPPAKGPRLVSEEIGDQQGESGDEVIAPDGSASPERARASTRTGSFEILRLRTSNGFRPPYHPEACTEKDRDEEDDEPGRPHPTNA